MRLINKIFRFPFAVIIAAVIAVFVYMATIFSMLFGDWDKEYLSLKTVHKDMYGFFLTIMGVK